MDPLDSFVAQLRSNLRDHVTHVLLFGSRATGQHRPDSDYDVAVFVRDDADLASLRRVVSDTAYPFVLNGHNVRPVVLSHSRKDEKSQFLGHIRDVGKPL